MYRQIENLEKKTAQLQTELDALKERLGENEKQTKYDIERHWNAICDLRFRGEPPQGNLSSQPASVAAPVGFPWALVIQILMAILTYLIQRAVTKSERDVLTELKSKLVRETGGTAE